ncbi:helix-turn-helix domain-containing protein [Tsuneonella sp. CC-YZS046]|uniref:helix-turn-helix domain-containing protein n=1 Tax=Tsuneonella sp. CC-YZS046 TaxID=3042152 RepID=UPI003A7F12F7
MDVRQCKMARAALSWSAKDLAEAAGLTRVTVARFESSQPIDQKSLSAMKVALEAAGAHFSHRGGRVGVSVPE